MAAVDWMHAKFATVLIVVLVCFFDSFSLIETNMQSYSKPSLFIVSHVFSLHAAVERGTQNHVTLKKETGQHRDNRTG